MIPSRWPVWGRIRRAGLVLTPDGVTYDTFDATSSVGWGDLLDVRFLTVLVAYLAHPRARAELGTPAALQRIEAGDFVRG